MYSFGFGGDPSTTLTIFIHMMPSSNSSAPLALRSGYLNIGNEKEIDDVCIENVRNTFYQC